MVRIFEDGDGVLLVDQLTESFGCELFDEDDNYCYARGEDWSLLALIIELRDRGFNPEVNQGQQKQTVIRF